MASLGKRGKPLLGQSREIIYNVYNYFVTEADRFKKMRMKMSVVILKRFKSELRMPLEFQEEL